MLRTAQWARIEGFKQWWKRYATGVRRGIAHGGLAVLPGAYYLFSLCRSDYAIELLGDALAHGLWALTIGEADVDNAWRVTCEKPDGICTTDSTAVAAAIVFGASRVPEAVPLLHSETVARATEYLLSRQTPEGGWHLFADEPRCSVEITAMAVHALCLRDRARYAPVVHEAARWLWSQQDRYGHWYDPSAPDPVYLTVLVLDAIELADGNTQVTFKMPGWTGEAAESKTPNPLRSDPNPEVACQMQTYEYLRKHTGRSDITCRAIAEEIGYSQSCVAKTAAWKAYEQGREEETERSRRTPSDRQQDKPDEKGFVQNPTDPAAYQGARRICKRSPLYAPNDKALKRILDAHTEIRRCKPSPQRLSVHLGDWDKYVQAEEEASKRAAADLAKRPLWCCNACSKIFTDLTDISSCPHCHSANTLKPVAGRAGK
jgi:hypothetical protein